MLSPYVLKTLLCALVALTYFGAVEAISPGYAVARRQAASRTHEAREFMTNAERLRRGFPLLPPRSLNPTKAGLGEYRLRALILQTVNDQILQLPELRPPVSHSSYPAYCEQCSG